MLELEGRDRVEAAVLVLELEGRCWSWKVGYWCWSYKYWCWRWKVGALAVIPGVGARMMK